MAVTANVPTKWTEMKLILRGT